MEIAERESSLLDSVYEEIKPVQQEVEIQPVDLGISEYQEVKEVEEPKEESFFEAPKENKDEEVKVEVADYQTRVSQVKDSKLAKGLTEMAEMGYSNYDLNV